MCYQKIKSKIKTSGSLNVWFQGHNSQYHLSFQFSGRAGFLLQCLIVSVLRYIQQDCFEKNLSLFALIFLKLYPNQGTFSQINNACNSSAYEIENSIEQISCVLQRNSCSPVNLCHGSVSEPLLHMPHPSSLVRWVAISHHIHSGILFF